MNDALVLAMLLFRRLEGAARQPLLLHELEARLSADGRSLVLSRYRERYSAEAQALPTRGSPQHTDCSIAALDGQARTLKGLLRARMPETRRNAACSA